MIQIGWLFFLPILIISIQSCTIIDILQMNSTDVIFTGRILSLHQWSVNHPYSAFVWVFRILRGESSLLEHYRSTHLQRPLYIILDNLGICEETSPLKYYDVKIFGIRIINARFQSSFAPLPVTVANMEAIEGKISYLIDLNYFFFSFYLLLAKINGKLMYSIRLLARSVNVDTLVDIGEIRVLLHRD
jgi:hypothetical protein